MASSTEQFGSGTTPVKSDTKRMLLVKDVKVGAGGGGGGVSQGNYGGGVPPFTPAGGAGIAFDNSNGRMWNYWGGKWN